MKMKVNVEAMAGGTRRGVEEAQARHFPVAIDAICDAVGGLPSVQGQLGWSSWALPSSFCLCWPVADKGGWSREL